MADKIDIFTAALRTEFEKGFNAIADPAPIEAAIEIIPSTARDENYAWLSPVPAIDSYKGYRRYGKISEVKYKVSNLEYDAAFEVLNRDIEDDQTGGYLRKSQDLGVKARLFPNRQSLKNLSLGQTTACFDATNFFAASHTIGSGNNILAGTAGGSDSVTHAMAVLVVGGPVKPLLWQNRKGPTMMTDAGTPESSKTKLSRYWADLEGAAAFGWWWDSLLTKWTNTPTVAEMQTTLGNAEAAFRKFQLPINLPSDTAEYVHEQLEFTDKTIVIVASTKIGHILRQALTLSLISNTENVYKGFAKQVTSAFMDGVV